MKTDLVTGFLGAGKTTFIQHYFRFLTGKGERVRIIENEFGAVNVDTRLLNGLTKEIDDLAGCCMCCTGKARFLERLATASKEGYDRVIVEPSGIYDVDEFFSTMETASSEGDCSIGNIITIVDAKADEGMTEETKYLMYAQLLSSGMIILSKTQNYDEDQPAHTRAFLEKIIGTIDPAQHLDVPVCEKDWSAFTEDDFAAFSSCGYHTGRHKRIFMDHMTIYSSWMTGNTCRDENDLREQIDRLFEDPLYGMVLRVKGFVRDPEKNMYEVNCTHDDRRICRTDIKRGLLVVIGQDLNSQKLNSDFLV